MRESELQHKPATESRDRKAFSDLIGLAESLQKQVEIYEQAIILTMLSLFIAILTVLFGSYIIDSVYAFSTTVKFFAILASFALIFLLFYLRARKLEQKMKREQRALEEAMSIIHEVSSALTLEFTPLELAEFKIRISRIDL